MRKPGQIYISKKGSVPDIVGAIAEVDGLLKGDTKELARKYPATKQGLENLYNYVVQEVKYKRDGETEVIKFPQKTLREKSGDCKSMSVLIGSVLKDKGIPYFYRFSYTDKDNPLSWHVYPVARIGGENIYMDAVIKRFNKEHPYVNSFDHYPKKIMAVSGVGEALPAGKVPPKNYIDTFNFSGGEISAILLYEQLNIITSQESSPELEASKAIIQDALYKGFNTGQGRHEIEKVKQPGLRAALIKATKDATAQNKSRNAASIADPLIPLENCATYLNQAYGQNNPAEYARCEAQNRYKRMLNEHLESSAHHLLYEYEAQPNRAPATVAAKKVLHVGAIDALADITKLSRNNLSLWLRNGVLRENAKRGVGALQPESTIPALKQAADEGIGGLPVAVVVAIISAIAAAVAGTLQLVGQMQATERARIMQSAQTIGQPNFGPLKTDWETYQQFQAEQEAAGRGGLANLDATTLAALAAGAYLIMKQ